MPTETKPQWKTDDGKCFATEAEAKKHEELTRLEAEYVNACNAYAVALRATQQTADGHSFDMRCCLYYYIRQGAGEPYIEEIMFSVWNSILDEDDRLKIIRYPNHEEARAGHGITTYRINELYALRKNAEKACIRLLAEYIDNLKDILARRTKEHGR
jgi:hypothetical protein